MLKNMNKTKRSNLITYAIVIVAFVVMQTLSSTGSISSLLTGLLVPLCTYIILAVSLNLVVGILGELSLGHAGFMCVGAFSSAFFSKCMRDVIANSIATISACTFDRCYSSSNLRCSHRNPGTSSERRLPCNRYTGIW